MSTLRHGRPRRAQRQEVCVRVRQQWLRCGAGAEESGGVGVQQAREIAWRCEREDRKREGGGEEVVVKGLQGRQCCRGGEEEEEDGDVGGAG